MRVTLEVPDNAETLCFSVMAKHKSTPISVGSFDCKTGHITECDVSMAQGETPANMLNECIQHVGYTPEQLGYDK